MPYELISMEDQLEGSDSLWPRDCIHINYSDGWRDKRLLNQTLPQNK
jgi:hypothetical protein